MPKVSPAHLDARRQQILDAARVRFATHGFARTSMTDLVEASELSVGAIYRYFKSKDEIITAICVQASLGLPATLTPASILEFLEHLRTLERQSGHARLVAQIYAEAAVSPELASLVREQLGGLRGAVVALLPDHEPAEAGRIAEAFVAICHGYGQQLAVRGDVAPEPFAAAIVAVIGV